MAKKIKKGISLDGLAVMIQRGFSSTVNKEEFISFKDEMYDFKDEMLSFKSKTESALYNINEKLQTIDGRIDAIEKTLGPLVHVTGALQREYRNHELRISKLERKVGVDK